MSYFFDAKFMNAKNCKIWLFLKHQFFRFFIISPIIFDLQECNIPQIKAKDILFWPYFLSFLATINDFWDRKQWSCFIIFTLEFINVKIVIFWKINFLVFSSFLWSHLTYRNILYLKLKLKTFHLDLMFSTFWLRPISYEGGSVEVVSFFLFQTLILSLPASTFRS